MLSHLYIQGLAVIETLSIDFTGGFNVITGETGAGKSILIKALGLLLGAKSSAETVRSGFTQATIAGEFDLRLTHRASQIVEQLGIAKDVHGDSFSLLIRRQISATGKSQAWVNDAPVTLSALKELGQSLIDIFGQHENQRLLDSSEHAFYLDEFIEDKKARTRYDELYEEVNADFSDIRETVEGFHTRLRERDYLAFRCQELDEFNPTTEDYEHVYSLCKMSGQFIHINKALLLAQQCLEEGAAGEALSKPLWEISKNLGQLKTDDKGIKELSDLALALASQVDELSYQIMQYHREEGVDEAELERAEGRLAGYQDLFRKLSTQDVAGLVAERDRLSEGLKSLDQASEAILEKLTSLSAKTKALEALAETIKKQRLQASKKIKQRVESELADLFMVGAKFDVQLSPVIRTIPALDLSLFGEDCQNLFYDATAVLSGLSESGSEKVLFLLSANPGEPSFALHKIASGGEVSRIMLALKRALAAGADSCLLVFDEIDAGISGKVADVVGKKMKDLAKNFQVLCISHLAQVAAYAESHFQVKKVGKKSRTESNIVQLSKKESIEEVARLLSGTEITKQSLANAKTLVERTSRSK